MKKAAFSFLSILLIGAFVFPQGAQALSALQIESILGLLRAFDADDSVVQNVSNTLQGNTGVSTSSIEYKDTLQLSRNLSRGMKGSDIERLQRYLRSTGDYSDDITGYYGVRTEAAVKSWQRKTGVVSGGTPETTGYGNVGPSTRTALTNAARTAVVVTPNVPDETRGVGTRNIDASAKFAATPTLGDAPLTVTFSTNLEQFSGLQGGGSIQLDYGDGSVIILCKPGVSGVSACTQEWSYPTYTYRQEGVYNAKLLRQLESGSSSVLGTISIVVDTYTPPTPTLPDETGGVRTATSPVPIIEFKVFPSRIERGQQTKLSWDVENAISCTLSEPHAQVETNIQPLDTLFEEGEVYPATHAMTVAPQATAQYTLTCTGVGGKASKEILIEVVAPVIINQERVIDGHNLYSADLVIDGGKTWIYFGGWLNQGQVHDNIYRAECSAGGTSCSNIQAVISSVESGFEHINDPSIVRMPGDYYIMYMTGVEEGGDGLDAAQNNIYFSTSWVGDGINWSKPQLLIENHWLPSAVLETNGTVSVYANDNISHGKVVRLNMGPSGVGLQESARVDYGTEDTHFNNVEVVRNGSGYRIVAERPTFPGSEIDLFLSADGLNWERTHKGMITTAPGENRVGTPTFHPTNTNSIFFGSTARSDSTGFKIYHADVSARVGSTTSGSFLSALGAALQKATASVADSFLFLFRN